MNCKMNREWGSGAHSQTAAHRKSEHQDLAPSPPSSRVASFLPCLLAFHSSCILSYLLQGNRDYQLHLIYALKHDASDAEPTQGLGQREGREQLQYQQRHSGSGPIADPVASAPRQEERSQYQQRQQQQRERIKRQNEHRALDICAEAARQERQFGGVIIVKCVTAATAYSL